MALIQSTPARVRDLDRHRRRTCRRRRSTLTRSTSSAKRCEEIYLTPRRVDAAARRRLAGVPRPAVVEFEPPADLRQRLEVLPQSYLAERRVPEKLKLATSPATGKQLLDAALKDQSQSSVAGGPLPRPAASRARLGGRPGAGPLGRNQVFAVRGDVDAPTVLLHGTLTNRRGHVVAAAWFSAEFPGFNGSGRPGRGFIQIHADAAEMLAAVGFGASATNPGPVSTRPATESLITAAVDAAADCPGRAVVRPRLRRTKARIGRWSARSRPGSSMPPSWCSACDLKRASYRRRARSSSSPTRWCPTGSWSARCCWSCRRTTPAMSRKDTENGGSAMRSWSAKTGSASTTSPLTPGSESFQAEVLERRKTWDDATRPARRRPDRGSRSSRTTLSVQLAALTSDDDQQPIVTPTDEITALYDSIRTMLGFDRHEFARDHPGRGPRSTTPRGSRPTRRWPSSTPRRSPTHRGPARQGRRRPCSTRTSSTTTHRRSPPWPGCCHTLFVAEDAPAFALVLAGPLGC